MVVALQLPRASSPFQGFLTASRHEVVRQLDGHDVVLMVGAQIFTYHVHTDGPFLPDGATALHITDNPTHAFSAPVGDSVLCSSGLGIRALLHHLPETTRSAPMPYVRPAPPSLTEPISADAVLHLLSQLMPAAAVAVEEAPSYRTSVSHPSSDRRTGWFIQWIQWREALTLRRPSGGRRVSGPVARRRTDLAVLHGQVVNT